MGKRKTWQHFNSRWTGDTYRLKGASVTDETDQWPCAMVDGPWRAPFPRDWCVVGRDGKTIASGTGDTFTLACREAKEALEKHESNTPSPSITGGGE